MYSFLLRFFLLNFFCCYIRYCKCRLYREFVAFCDVFFPAPVFILSGFGKKNWL